MSTTAAELLKLRRAWSTWILVGILALSELLLGYLLIFAVLQAPDDQLGDARDFLLRGLLPAGIVANVLTMLAGLGGALALVLGAMSSAREYGWRTITTLLTQRPTRIGYLGGKVTALAILTLIMTLATFAIAALASVLVASSLGETIAFPTLADFAVGVAAGWLILGAWTTLGFGLGLLFRSTGLAIGLGLVYALVLETIIQAMSGLDEAFATVSRGLLGFNAASLASTFGPELPATFGPVIDVAPMTAAAVLAAYVVVSVLVSGLIFLRRDVT